MHRGMTALEARHPGIIAALPLLALGALLWGQLAIALHPWWTDGSYYDYGWLVPLLAIWCLWARWQNLGSASRVLNAQSLSWIPLVVVVFAILWLTLVRLIERSDPLWRIPIWAHALTVVTLWHVILHHLTKRTWYFLPVTLLALTAVPLPPMLEGALIHRLTEAVLAYSVPISRFMGIPVEMEGTALAAGGRILQIDDGCSGIRSFQSLLMISVFFGEFFFLGWLQRIGMVVTGFLSAFVFNGLRTLTLTWIFFDWGEAHFHEFHDGVGMVSFALSAVATYLVAWKLAGPAPQSAPS